MLHKYFWQFYVVVIDWYVINYYVKLILIWNYVFIYRFYCILIPNIFYIIFPT